MSGDVLPAAVLADVGSRVARIRERIAAAAARAGRAPQSVRIVGACKRQPLERVAAAVFAGVDALGENYVQEARDTQARLAELLAAHSADQPPPDVHWRLIGHLQSNKAALAARLFEAVDTVDRAKVARALDKHAASAGVRLEVLLQVNLSREAQKSGAPEDEIPGLLADCRELEHLRVVGLMTMPAASPDPESSRPVFARLRALRDTLQEGVGAELPELSMGMSGDFEVAVEEGATLVRIGTALFGEREPAGQAPPGRGASHDTGEER